MGGAAGMTLKFDEICIDAHDITELGAWWAEVLGWAHDITSEGDVVLHPPPGAGPDWIFIAVTDDKAVTNRLHLDLRPDDQEAEVERLVDMGARQVDTGRASSPGWSWPTPRATSSASSPPTTDSGLASVRKLPPKPACRPADTHARAELE